MLAAAIRRSRSGRFGAQPSTTLRTAAHRSLARVSRMRSKSSVCNAASVRLRLASKRWKSCRGMASRSSTEAGGPVERQVQFEIGGKHQLVKAGDFIYAPGGTIHAFKGASAQPARLLVFDAPAHAEGFFREVDREVKEMPQDLQKVPAIGLRHQLRFLPPA